MPPLWDIIKAAFTGENSPLFLNTFNGAIPVYISLAITAFLVLVQSLVLKTAFKEYPYKKHSVAAFLMKSASTISASLAIFITNKQDDFFIDSLAGFSCVALISAITEYPLLMIFYNLKETWKRCFAYAALLNAIVFGVLFCTEKLLLAGGLIYHRCNELAAISDWNHKEILEGESGFIYFMTPLPKDFLARYSVASGRTELLNGRSFYNVLSSWSVSAGKLVCMLDKDKKYNSELFFSVVSLPHFRRISIVKARETPGNYDDARPFLDRSGNHLAMIESLGNIVAQKNRAAWYSFGEKARIHLCRVKTGEEFYQYPELVIGGDGFDWSPDSKKIVFVNFRDRDLFIPSQSQMKGHIDIGSDKHPKFLYTYDLDSRTLTELCEGTRPNWSPDGKNILFVKNRTPYLYSFESKQTTKLFKQDSYAYKWSPTGKNIICYSNGHLIVVNIANPDKKLIIQSDYYGEFFWSNE